MKKIGIIGAMEAEVSLLKQQMQVNGIQKKANMEFFEGTLEGKEVVVVQCGIGKVNAAMCVQILSDLFGVTHVLNTGVAGSLNAQLNIGDLLVSIDAVQHDVDVTIFGYAKGQIPGTDRREFVADEQMGKVAVGACRRANPGINVIPGHVVSGDQFISSKEVKDVLIREFHGDCAEMEGASIAQAATLNGLPFLIIRAISDKADGSAEMDYPAFEAEAARHCAAMVREFIKEF
ncbi:MAG: 5'-methylthioadenosine/adenosylhomocysteine nucleosidase [Lachnospiraceae bacterium]|nr:5'-methylthioadenosine/adenosylhomocysteine nucleosidase [Lachnospiraceae bacterium]